MSVADRVRGMLLTGFGLGLVPIASGTFGTIPGVVVAVVLGAALEGRTLALALLGLAAVLFLFGIAQTRYVERTWGGEDPGQVVLDEIVGYLITIGVLALFGTQPGPWAYALGFVAFRVFDVVKPPPCDRLEELPGALGIMADDVVAGLYAGIVLLLADGLGFVR